MLRLTAQRVITLRNLPMSFAAKENHARDAVPLSQKLKLLVVARISVQNVRDCNSVVNFTDKSLVKSDKIES